MIRPNYKVELYKFDENTLSPYPVDISNAISFSVTTGIETRRDTFKLNYGNYKIGDTWQKTGGKKNIYDNFVRSGDNIKIYIWNGSVQPTNMDSYLIMDGEVGKFSHVAGEKELNLTIDGTNRTENLLSNLVPTSHTDQSSFNTSPLIIMEILNRVNKFNTLKPPITYGLTTGTNAWTGLAGNIQAVDSEGNSFPAIAYHQNYKKAYDQIEELSKPDFTGDDKNGNYIFYVKYTPALAGGYVNEFVWKSKDFNTVGSIEEGIDFGTYSADYDIRDVVNAMIVSCGQDCYGHGKTTVVTNLDSMGKYGAKWKFYPATTIIPDLIKAEIAIGSPLGSTYDTDNIPDVLTSGSYELQFEARDDNGTQLGTKAIAGNKKQYNNLMRTEGKWQGQAQAQKIVDTLGSPRYSISFELNNFFKQQYELGDLYDIKCESFGWDGTESNPMKKLRIYQIDYIMNTDGIITTLNLMEDEKTAGII